MHIEEILQKAVGRFDWQMIEERLRIVERSELRAWSENFLDVVLRDGYLILRRPDVRQKVRRDAFLEHLRLFLRDQGMADLIDNRKGQFSSLEHTEVAYQQVLTTFRTALQARLLPEELVWAVIRTFESQNREMLARIWSTHPGIEQVFDPVVAKLPVDADGHRANPDEVLNTLERTLTATLKMLGYDNGWFDHDSALVLPLPVPTTEEHQNNAQGTFYLAATWSQIERSDGQCRYFRGAVTRGEVEFQDVQHPEKCLHRGEAIQFTFENGLEIMLHIAGERLQRMLFDFFVSLDRSPALAAQVVGMPPVPSAPQGYVSVDEAHGALALSHVFFKSVFEIETPFAGLTLLEWLRGYAVVKKLAREHLKQPQPAEEIVLVDEMAVIKSLVDHGLPGDKARVFFRHICFDRDSEDTFDAPFIRCRDGCFCFIVSVAAQLNPAFVVLSQLCSLRCDMSWKGDPFEANTLDLFRTHKVDAARLHRQIDGEEVQIDCVAVWDEVLFVCENKNYFLPSDNPRSEFWFLQDQVAAAHQVMKKVEAIEAHPEIVSEALNKTVTWKRIVPVVLNGAPFSLPGPVEGVHFYDASVIHRFFEDGYIAYSMLRGDGEAPRVIPETVTPLWSGEHPSAEDLIRQMERPVQVARIARDFRRVRRVLPISRQLYVATVALERTAPTVDCMAKGIGAGKIK